MAATAKSLVLDFRETDSRFGVTRPTLGKLADTLGLSETQVVHYALSRLAKEVLPAYACEPDDGPLSKRELQVIQKAARGRRGKSTRSAL